MTQLTRNKVVVLVVDDQLIPGTGSDRTALYKEALGRIDESLKPLWELDVRLCSRPGSVATSLVDPNQPAIVLLDMVLGDLPWTSISVSELDDWLVHHGIPTMLVSEHFHQPGSLARANRLAIRFAERKIPFQIQLWQTLAAAAADSVIAEQLAFPIGVMLSVAQGRDPSFVKGQDEPIGFLHLTDSHFGVATWDAGALAVLKGRLRDGNLGAADFLLLTGDVSHRGAPHEYQLASDYLHSLAHNGLVSGSSTSLPMEKVFVVPGNHDFVREIALGANVKSVSKDSYTIENLAQPQSDWIKLKARDPYHEFEQGIAGREISWTPSPGFRVDTRYVGVGLVFLELDIEKNEIDGYQSGATDEDIRKRLKDATTALVSVRRAGECVVVLAHRHVDDKWIALGAMLTNFFAGLSTSGPVVLFCGHVHDAKVGAEYAKRLLLVRGVPAVKGPPLPETSLPKMHFVELLRVGGAVRGATVHTFHQGIGEWLNSGEALEFSWTQKGGWG